MQPTPSSPPQAKKPRKIKWKYIVPIIVVLIATVGSIIVAIITRPQPQAITPTPTTAPSVTASSTLPSATIPPTPPAWLVQPTAQFGADAPNHTINLILYPGDILSLTTDVGTFMARASNGSLIPVPLQAASGKDYVLIWEGDRNSTAETVQVTGVSSGNIDWERRQPPPGTPGSLLQWQLNNELQAG